MKALSRLIAAFAAIAALPAISAAQATPIAVTSVAVAGAIATVNTASPHGYVAGQGVCNLASSQSADIVCATVATVPSGTQFTYSQSGAAACAAACGTTQPAKRFIVGPVAPFNQQGLVSVTFCIWTTTSNGVARSGGATSACPGASSPENAAIAAGSTLESLFTMSFPANWTLAKLQTFLLDLQSSMQSQLAGGVQPGALLGRFCDGSSGGGCN